MPGLWDTVDGWARDILNRPREITPFLLEGDTRMEGDPSSPEGAIITGPITMHPDWNYEIQGGSTVVVFQKSKGQSSGFTGECYCTESVGSCVPYVGPNSVVCGSPSDGSDNCLGECKMRVKLPKGRKLAQAVLTRTN